MRIRKIKGYENYLIREDGVVLSKYKPKTNKVGKTLTELKSVLDKGVGYYLVTLCENGKRSNKFIHRLLAEAFIENPEEKPMVNHIDGVKANNQLENLEWVTAKENSQHANKMGLNKPTCKAIEQINLATGAVIASYDSSRTAFNITGVAYQNISKVLRGIRKHAGGYSWRYKKCVETIPVREVGIKRCRNSVHPTK